MYTIYCINNGVRSVLYKDGITEFTLIDPKLVLELNTAGSLEFEIDPSHPCYGTEYIERMITLVEVWRDGTRLFKGRVLSEELDWYNVKKVTCEGELAYLNDSVIRPYDWSGDDSVVDDDGNLEVYTGTDVHTYLSTLIGFHNDDVGEDSGKSFQLGEVVGFDEDDDGFNNGYYSFGVTNANYASTWSNISSKLIDDIGGYIFLTYDEDDNRYLNYYKSFEDADEGKEEYASQVVQFGKNLLDIGDTISGEDLCTVIIPVGGETTVTVTETDEDGNETETEDEDHTVTLADVTEDDLTAFAGEYPDVSLSFTVGTDYLVNDFVTLSYDSEGNAVTPVAKYGRIVKSGEWDYIVTPYKLLVKAYEYLCSSCYISETIELTAVDLARLDSSMEAFSLGTIVRAYSKPHNMDHHFLLSKLEIYPTKPDKDKLTLGETFKSLSLQTVVNNNTVSIVRSSLAGTDETVSNLVSDLNATNAQLSTLETTKADQEDLDSATADISDLQTSVSTLEGEALRWGGLFEFTAGSAYLDYDYDPARHYVDVTLDFALSDGSADSLDHHVYLFSVAYKRASHIKVTLPSACSAYFYGGVQYTSGGTFDIEVGSYENESDSDDDGHNNSYYYWDTASGTARSGYLVAIA